MATDWLDSPSRARIAAWAVVPVAAVILFAWFVIQLIRELRGLA